VVGGWEWVGELEIDREQRRGQRSVIWWMMCIRLRFLFYCSNHLKKKKRSNKKGCVFVLMFKVYIFLKKKNQNGAISQVRAKWEETTRGMHVQST
jgi:hypothetical protein